MKKWIIVLCALALLCGLSGCLGTSSAENLSTLEVEEWPGEGSYPDFSKYEANLSGLCAFLEDGKVVTADDNYPVTTQAQVIGAKEGKRYRFKYNGSTVQVELYEFDPGDLNEQAKAVLAEAQMSGSVTVLNNTSPAAADDGNRFLMLYIDTKTDEANEVHRDMANSYFANFCINH